jgi:hypothetical protein
VSFEIKVFSFLMELVNAEKFRERLFRLGEMGNDNFSYKEKLEEGWYLLPSTSLPDPH